MIRFFGWYDDMLILFYQKKEKRGRRSAIREEYLGNLIIQPLEARCNVSCMIP